MSFEIQDLFDILRVVVLLSLKDGSILDRNALKHRVDKHCGGHVTVDMHELDKALAEMTSEGLVKEDGGKAELTEKGLGLGKEWGNLLLKREPILEFIAGLTDGSITSLVIILSALLSKLSIGTTMFAAVISLTAVAVTGFSSFMLGSKTEDMADLITLKTLVDYSLSDIPDKTERDKSLRIVKQLFEVLHDDIGMSSIKSAMVCSIATFLAGSIPIAAYITLPTPINIILSLGIVGMVVGVFIVRYRSKRSRIHWKLALIDTVIIIAIAVIVSLLIGSHL